jgi:hypothetical protein
MEKRNPYLAAIARYQYLSGFRVSESIRQKGEYISENIHESKKAKGGLDNKVHVDHLTEQEKAFVDDLKKNEDKDTGRIFHRQKDKSGNYKSDEQIRRAVTRLASSCAKKIGIGESTGKTFTSHSFRGGFAHNRMVHYCKNKKKLDQLIANKIAEDPKRLAKKYRKFEERILNKTDKKRRHLREIHDYEKIQWLVSTDLNHSRQDIVRYYVHAKTIKEELKKW